MTGCLPRVIDSCALKLTREKIRVRMWPYPMAARSTCADVYLRVVRRPRLCTETELSNLDLRMKGEAVRFGLEKNEITLTQLGQRVHGLCLLDMHLQGGDEGEDEVGMRLRMRWG